LEGSLRLVGLAALWAAIMAVSPEWAHTIRVLNSLPPLPSTQS
jgi:hypothetical protein